MFRIQQPQLTMPGSSLSVQEPACHLTTACQASSTAIISGKFGIAVAVALLCVWSQTGSAYAYPQGDYFARESAPRPAQMPKLPVAKAADPAAVLHWFEAFDEVVFQHKPTTADDVILSRPINQQMERVLQWSATAGKVAKRYRELVRILKSMPVPANVPGLKDYRDFTADWYSDAALIYEDLIRPVRPAKTREELQDDMKDIDTRSERMAHSSVELRNMDSQIRTAYNVHPPRQDDALMKYVSTK